MLERVGGGVGDGGAGHVGDAGGVYEEWIGNELERLRAQYEGVWCVERRVKAGEDGVGWRKRKRKAKPGSQIDTNGEDEIQELNLHPKPTASPINLTPLPWYLTAHATHKSSLTALHHCPIHNAHSTPCHLDLLSSYKQQREPHRYLIPPFCTFLLSSINLHTTPAFTHTALMLLPESTPSTGPGQFDFVLLDPPWANRSVRRSGGYSTTESHGGDPMAALEGMLGQHVAPRGLVGCWITNKPAVRTAALNAFKRWRVELIEEWVWVKVTSGGEPVTVLGGVWRKPYEVLLLGRKGGKVEGGVARRLIVAVSDLHSRKPSLRELIEPMMPDGRRYRALEVFARNLTAGWWAWADECLKYNWDGCWSGAD